MAMMSLLIIAGLVIAGGAVPQVPVALRGPLGLALFALGVVAPVAIVVMTADPRPAAWAAVFIVAALACVGLMAVTISRARSSRQRIVGLVASGILGMAVVVLAIITS